LADASLVREAGFHQVLVEWRDHCGDQRVLAEVFDDALSREVQTVEARTSETKTDGSYRVTVLEEFRRSSSARAVM